MSGITTTQTVTVDGVSIPTNDQSAQVINKLQGDMEALQKQVEAKDGEIATLTTDKETLTGKVATLEKTVADSKITPQALNDMAKKRAKVMHKAKAVMGKVDENLDDEAIMRATVEKHLGDAMPAEMSDEAVGGAFASIKVDDADSDQDPIRAVLGDGVKTTTVPVADESIYAAAGLKMAKGA